MCLKMSKDIKTLSPSELYGIILNHEQNLQLKKNIIKDVKDSKSTSVALHSESIPLMSLSTITITQLDDCNSKGSSDVDAADLDESLTMLTNIFQRFAQKSNFQRNKPLVIADKLKSTLVDKASTICYNCQGKSHFAS